MKYKWMNPTAVWQHNSTHGSFNVPLGKDAKGKARFGYHCKEPIMKIAEKLTAIQMRLDSEQ